MYLIFNAGQYPIFPLSEVKRYKEFDNKSEFDRDLELPHGLSTRLRAYFSLCNQETLSYAVMTVASLTEEALRRYDFCEGVRLPARLYALSSTILQKQSIFETYLRYVIEIMGILGFIVSFEEGGTDNSQFFLEPHQILTADEADAKQAAIIERFAVHAANFLVQSYITKKYICSAGELGLLNAEPRLLSSIYQRIDDLLGPSWITRDLVGGSIEIRKA